ncbi:zinc finger protein CONSTANS-LIKE 5-like [Cucurbita pepo subsp. pepo]|uniref:zinc finger protein CONSTANS-LIKE 5-like n=1 Tax=Cucurbita pepo subsp. pepo TaxID=3664 RepID=UPI000C9DA6F0|nr:zinc finger protein CONSTANS-LIKE 5-like [Cucurbita pepo subsp. pepo]
MHSFAGGWPAVATAKPLCYSCKSAPAALFCRHDAAFLCLRCDDQIHSHTTGTRHPRVWLCEVCEQAPATITCNADAAALCPSCDADIHSVNPLARRHDRSAIQPFYDSPPSASVASVFKFLLPTQHQHDVGHPDLKSEDIFFSDMDSLIDFDYPTAGDGVVPDQSNPGTESTTQPADYSTGNFCGFELCSTRSKLDTISYPSHNLSHSVSSSSLDVVAVPDRNTASDASYPAGQTALPTTEKVVQLRGMDREARVLRYREKKKNRKFEKTIRYASRKAYAEIRPRVKGRFVKRSEMKSEMERMYAGAGVGYMSRDGQYGVVPSLIV